MIDVSSPPEYASTTFLISFLNIKSKIMIYIRSFRKKQNILGVLGILLKFIPKELTKDIIKLL